MAFEGHVERELARAGSGLVPGEDFWFNDGLRVVSDDVAQTLIEVLDDSGEFGPTRISTKENEIEILIEFGTHEQHFNGDLQDYIAYCNDFWSGEEK